MKHYILHLILSLALVTSLVYKGGESGPFSSLIKKAPGFPENDAIKLTVKMLTKEEAKKHLTQDIEALGYFPIQITVENESADPYFLSPDLIEMETANNEEIAQKIINKSLPRSIGFKIAGLFFWPLKIVETFDSLMTIKTRNELHKSLLAKSVKEEVVPAYGTINRIFFVAKERYQDSYTISLQNLEDLNNRVFPIEGEKKEDLQIADPLPCIQENYYLTNE